MGLQSPLRNTLVSVDILGSYHLLLVPCGIDEDLIKVLVVIRDEGYQVVDYLVIWI